MLIEQTNAQKSFSICKTPISRQRETEGKKVYKKKINGFDSDLKVDSKQEIRLHFYSLIFQI